VWVLVSAGVWIGLLCSVSSITALHLYFFTRQVNWSQHCGEAVQRSNDERERAAKGSFDSGGDGFDDAGNTLRRDRLTMVSGDAQRSSSTASKGQRQWSVDTTKRATSTNSAIDYELLNSDGVQMLPSRNGSVNGASAAAQALSRIE
jgi:hypothetical protein